MSRTLSVPQSFEDYFLRRMAEEAVLARHAATPAARHAHLRACSLYRDLLDRSV